MNASGRKVPSLCLDRVHSSACTPCRPRCPSHPSAWPNSPSTPASPPPSPPPKCPSASPSPACPPRPRPHLGVPLLAALAAPHSPWRRALPGKAQGSGLGLAPPPRPLPTRLSFGPLTRRSRRSSSTAGARNLGRTPGPTLRLHQPAERLGTPSPRRLGRHHSGR